MQDNDERRIDVAAAQRRLITLDGHLRLLLLRRAGLRIRLSDLRHTETLASANLRLAIAQSVTAGGTPVYSSPAARHAAFTLAAENDLVLHALAALLDHVQRRLEVTEAEVSAIRAERADLRATLR